jgi:hypothetical protein
LELELEDAHEDEELLGEELRETEEESSSEDGDSTTGKDSFLRRFAGGIAELVRMFNLAMAVSVINSGSPVVTEIPGNQFHRLSLTPSKLKTT